MNMAFPLSADKVIGKMDFSNLLIHLTYTHFQSVTFKIRTIINKDNCFKYIYIEDTD